jgi:hypothetical protein
MDGRNLKVKSNKLVSVTRVRVNNRLRKESWEQHMQEII